ncbi:unnamed protein product [Vitrella brassicaformis CCMP3155]|uniref:Mini-chromosome maintenance complex-binding protein n=1 Tax=Vitrella brassicaformis (strain CCMP3155) TaxID=1169540 RepID=A0A0G4EPY0_VITBC|nr:unnamed protein product [Vitrella brassicaformis CCMP3155]|eukprot:CEL99653.1 unnamed protein product [Vitrella brassicaformis CCMP3155]
MASDIDSNTRIFVTAYPSADGDGYKVVKYRHDDASRHWSGAAHSLRDCCVTHMQAHHLIPIPGQTQWAKRRDDEGAGSGDTSGSSCVVLVDREPQESHPLVRAGLQLHETVEVIGVYEKKTVDLPDTSGGECVKASWNPWYQPFMTADVDGGGSSSNPEDTSGEDGSYGNSSSSNKTYRHVIHAIAVRTLQHYSPILAYTPTADVEARSNGLDFAMMRRRIIKHIAGCLGGDELAATYVLWSLAASWYKNRRGERVNPFSLSIQHPTMANTHTKSRLINSIEQLVCRVVRLPMSREALQKMRVASAKHDGLDTDDMVPGVLALADGTLVLLDETLMTEGTLHPPGLSNLMALDRCVSQGLVEVDYGVYRKDYSVDLNFIAIATGSSLLKFVDVALPIEPLPGYDIGRDVSPSVVEVDESMLDQMRFYLTVVKSRSHDKPLNLTQDQMDRIAAKFAEERGRDRSIPTDTLHLWLKLARANVATYGRTECEHHSWFDDVVAMEDERRRRVKAKRDTPQCN